MEKIVVGMSGGVDSSVAAYLLKEKGYEVIGVTLGLWEDTYKEAKAICDYLGIEFCDIDKKDKFKECVVDYFNKEYICARTPNPCVACNRYLKWDGLIEYADTIGARYIATGHYSHIHLGDNGRFSIKRAKDTLKDQTYVLYTLSQETLSRIVFPLADYSKEEVRKIANNIGLSVANKKDSQDICFVPDGDYLSFIRNNYNGKIPGAGDFVDTSGNILGKHNGIANYTIGQRKGLGISLGKRTFVVRIDSKNNQVVLGDDSEVFSNSLEASDICFMAQDSFDPKREYIGRIRYSHEGSPCKVIMLSENRMRVEFKEPVRAITPGQAIVLYDGDLIAGGAIID